MEIEVRVFIYKKPLEEYLKGKQVISITTAGKYCIVITKKAD